MANFAIHDGVRVVNVIVADTAEIAEEVTGLVAVETNGEPWVDWMLHGAEWRPPAPFPSWVWDGDTWVAPVLMPSDPGVWAWNEDAQTWIDTTLLTE